MNDGREITFTVEEGGERLDRVLAEHLPDVSRAQVQRLVKSGAVTVNGSLSKPSYRVEPGDRLSALLPEEVEEPLQAEQIPLQIVYEDEHLLAVDKPAGMVVHPGAGHSSGTLANALLAHCPQIADVGGLERSGIVHRLDKDTSGLLLVAKEQDTHAALQRQFKRRHVLKSYLALVEDHIEPREGIVEAAIGRDRRERKRMTVTRTGRPAVTQYRAVEFLRRHTLLEVRPHTGRTHQIRVHLTWIGFPLVGDRVYGHKRQPLLPDRHFLHAHELGLTHPVTEGELNLTSPLPPNLARLVERLRKR